MTQPAPKSLSEEIEDIMIFFKINWRSDGQSYLKESTQAILQAIEKRIPKEKNYIEEPSFSIKPFDNSENRRLYAMYNLAIQDLKQSFGIKE